MNFPILALLPIVKELISSILSGRKKGLWRPNHIGGKQNYLLRLRQWQTFPFRMNLVFAMILVSLHTFQNFVTSHLWLDRKNLASNTFRLFWASSAQNFSILHMKTKVYIKHIFMNKINSKYDHGAINCTF